jgi:hypothetical protein
MTEPLRPRAFSSSSRNTVRSALALALTAACTAGGFVRAQQLIGYVSTRDAEVTGASDVLDGEAVLMGSVVVTARDHTAPITLGRGGTVRVCQTSVLHVTESRGVEVAAPLLFSLDRGAIEVQTNGTATDAIMTPDLRFTVRTSGPLDLRMRVGRNGDTCVENRGAVAPTLAVSDPFGESMYELSAGQHVLFEHGSLHEVVDHESSPCGCPDEKGMSVAEALLAPGAGANSSPRPSAPPVPPTPSAEQHPFPAAVSEGLAPTPAFIPAPAVAQQQPVNGALHYPPDAASNPSAAEGSAGSTSGVAIAPGPANPPAVQTASAAAPAARSKKASKAAPAVTAAAAPASAQSSGTAQNAPAPAQPAPAKPPRDLVHVIGHFFKKIFG